MLRLLTLVLVLANTGYFAWTRGWLVSYGLAPAVQAEPQRMADQIRPGAMRLLTPDEASSIETASVSSAPSNATPNPDPNSSSNPGSTSSVAAVTSSECWQAGVFNSAQVSRLDARLEEILPPGSWSFETSTEPGRWIIYMGKFANEEAQLKKRGELRALGQSVEPLLNLSLNPGLSLGHFSSAEQANLELAKASKHGVRTARVLLERAEVTGKLLRVNAVNTATRAKLDALQPQFEGSSIQPCL